MYFTSEAQSHLVRAETFTSGCGHVGHRKLIKCLEGYLLSHALQVIVQKSLCSLEHLFNLYLVVKFRRNVAELVCAVGSLLLDVLLLLSQRRFDGLDATDASNVSFWVRQRDDEELVLKLALQIVHAVLINWESHAVSLVEKVSKSCPSSSNLWANGPIVVEKSLYLDVVVRLTVAAAGGYKLIPSLDGGA